MKKTENQRIVENLVRESFRNVYRPGCSEHYVIRVLRDDPAFVKEPDFVMEQKGRLMWDNLDEDINRFKTSFHFGIIISLSFRFCFVLIEKDRLSKFCYAPFYSFENEDITGITSIKTDLSVKAANRSLSIPGIILS